MITLGDLDDMLLARELIRAGLRLPITRAMTNVSVRVLRQWWKDIHGTRPVTGKLPETILSFIKNDEQAVVNAAFVVGYLSKYGREMSAVNLLNEWHTFCRQHCHININSAYYAVRDVRAQIVMLATCRNHESETMFLYDRGSKYTDHCPFCGTHISDS